MYFLLQVILPTPSKHRTSTKSGHNLEATHSIPTNITNINNTSDKTSYNNEYNFNNNENYLRINNYDFNNETDGLRSDNNYNRETVLGATNNNFNNNTSDVNIPLKRTETRSVLSPKRNIYKDYVQKEIRDWFQEVPIYPNLGRNDFDKVRFVNDLTDKINNISTENKTEAYDEKVKFDIDNSLSNVPMWYPGAKRDQDYFKNKLNDNLLNRIKDLNKKLLINNNNDANNDNCRRSSNRDVLSNSEQIEEEVCDWLSMIKFRKSSGMQMNVDKKEVAKAVMKRIGPLLKKPMNSKNYKVMLKCDIVNVLNDLPIGARCSRNRNIHLHIFADDLTNRLLSIKAKENCEQFHNTQRIVYQTSDVFVHKNTERDIENIIHKEIIKCLANTRLTHNNDVKFDIFNIIMDYIDSPIPVEESNFSKKILDVLKSASNIPEFIASNIAQNIIKEVKYALNEAGSNVVSNIKPTVTRKISVYTSQEKCCPMSHPVTSTPKKKKPQSVPKLNAEEIEYADKVGNLIRAWMETLPEQFNAPDEKDFKETIIKDLAGEITDEAKLEQLASVDEKEKWLKYLVYKWLHKLDVFDLEEVAPQIEDLLKKVKHIPVPVLTKPQHGNRQAMANIQHMESERGWEEYFVPKGKDILEDEISIWLNQQPSEIFDNDKNTRNTKIKELAEVLQDKLTNKNPEKEISNDVVQWLNKIVKPDQKNKVGELADNLKGRVVNLPQDTTLAANRDKKVQERAEHLEAKNNPSCQIVKIKTTDNDTINLDKTMQQFIGKFIKHNYDVDDPLARGAFSHLLKTKLQRLNPPTRKEVYANFAKSETNNQFAREKLMKELDYIKDISDWLKNIPIGASYNTVGNRERVDFVTDLARNIQEVEEQREGDPDAMDYNMYMASIISQFLVQLPINQEYKNDKNMMFMIDQLVGKIIVHRNKNLNVHDSLDTSGVHSDNIGDFIEEFLRVNGSEIADDEVKLEAWSVRLLDEIKKMVRENADPTTLSKAQVYNRLTNVPVPGNESIKQFDDEFEYIKEISQWLKNLPLLPIDETNEDERIKMICELTEKITERDIKKSNNPNDIKTDTEFAEYISKWISDLSLDETQEVVVAIVIEQLINRIERVKVRQEKPNHDFSGVNETNDTDNNPPKINKKQSCKTIKVVKSKQIKNPASCIVDTIEKWSASLPIKSCDEKAVKSLKDDASKKLFQKVGELSIDPRTFNDDLLYQDILSDEVDAIIEKLPQSPELDNNKEKLRTNLVQNIVEAQKAIKEKCAGEFYKHKLEHTIEASMPHPVNARRAYDPGFEIYKSRLADMFILENYDHANDAVKIKYERRVKDEIDKYYDSVKNKNAIPLTKDEIYNELYSVLFKVPIPKESSVIGEVEEIKTRCEIDAWFELLPLKDANGISEMLERDKVLATLAKRIHEIEMGPKPADKIHKEIMKWVVKLPLLPGEESNAEQFAKKLQDTLKSSAGKRKCVATEPSSKSKKGKTKVKSKEKIRVNKDDNQIPGPSTAGKMWENQSELVKPKKTAAEIIIEIVEEWCHQVPVCATTPHEQETAKTLRDNLSTKIIIKISELNMNPDTFNDDFQYEDLLDEELDILLAVIPTCRDFEESKAAKKMQLKNAIKSIKPLFKEERAKYQYKQDLDATVVKVLGKPEDTTAEKETLFKDLKEEIVENFVQYKYEKDDDEGRQAYKIKVHEAVVKFLTSVVENRDKTSLDPLMMRNQLLCELAKIPVPSDEDLKEEVEEIRMKNDVTEFFDELSVSGTGQNNKELIKQVKSSLAKKLNDIERSGHNAETENKMKQEINKSLKKVNKEVKPEVIGDFITKLNDSKNDRRAPRKIKSDMTYACEENTRTKENSNFSPDSNTTESKNCLEHCQNLQKSSDTSLKQELSVTKTEVECECPSNEFPQQERPRHNESHDNNDEGRCICGGLRGRRPYFMPMRWFWNGPEDMPICRMPAGFFYY